MCAHYLRVSISYEPLHAKKSEPFPVVVLRLTTTPSPCLQSLELSASKTPLLQYYIRLRFDTATIEDRKLHQAKVRATTKKAAYI